MTTTRVTVIDVATGAAQVVITGTVTAATWSPTEDRLIVAGTFDGEAQVLTMARDGSDRAVLSRSRVNLPVSVGPTGDVLWVDVPGVLRMSDSRGLDVREVPNLAPLRTVGQFWLVDACTP